MKSKTDVSSVASHVIAKCGGVEVVASLIGRSAASVYKWRWSRQRSGTGGLVPADAAQKLMEAARRGEIDLAPEDFFPLNQNSAEHPEDISTADR